MNNALIITEIFFLDKKSAIRWIQTARRNWDNGWLDLFVDQDSRTKDKLRQLQLALKPFAISVLV